MGLIGNDAEPPLLSKTDIEFLRGLAKATIESARKKESVPSLGFPVVTPGGAYPSCWVRDFSMATGCGLIPHAELVRHLYLFATAQNGPRERTLRQGEAIIPPFAIPDHVNYDGGAVFYPGTYDSGEAQGGEPYGILPPVDDHYEFIHIAYRAWKGTGNPRLLSESIAGIPLFDRLRSALDAPTTDPDTGLVITDPAQRAVGFGFVDGIYLTGSLLFASLLRYRALGEMIAMATALKRLDLVSGWKAAQSKIQAHLYPVFEANGWLRAATGVGRQFDVWGTIYALYLGALPSAHRDLLRRTILRSVADGTILYQGAVRHIPTTADFSPTSAWEQTGESLNRYQNGAFWHVPTGWLVAVLWTIDKPRARQVAEAMVTHFREEDFRLGKGNGAPWENIHPDGRWRQNPVYMASITLPLECIQGLH